MAISKVGFVTGKDDRELTEHGTAFFPIACYYDDLPWDTVQWHWHEEFEALFVTEGAAEVSLEKEKCIIKEGDGMFINAGALHAIRLTTASRCRFHSIVFHPRLVGGSKDSVFWLNYIEPLILQNTLKSVLFDGSEAWHSKACEFIETAWHVVVEEPFGYEFQVRSALSQLVLLLKMYLPAGGKELSERELRDTKRIRIMIQYIQEHYMEELNTAQIAGSAMISESECLRCFHKTIGMPPVQYMKQFRIQKAAELLLSTEKKIGDIGAECGFLDTSYFTKVFREMKGCTPGKYRSQGK